ARDRASQVHRPDIRPIQQSISHERNERLPNGANLIHPDVGLDIPKLVDAQEAADALGLDHGSPRSVDQSPSGYTKARRCPQHNGRPSPALPAALISGVCSRSEPLVSLRSSRVVPGVELTKGVEVSFDVLFAKADQVCLRYTSEGAHRGQPH